MSVSGVQSASESVGGWVIGWCRLGPLSSNVMQLDETLAIVWEN